MTDGDGSIILRFKDAQQKAFTIIESCNPSQKKLTLNDAIELYMAWYKQHRKAYAETLSTVEAHIRPMLGSKYISELTTREIKHWHKI